MKEYFTLKEVAAKTKFHPETIRLTALRVGIGCKMLGEWRFTEEEIERLQECPSEKGKAVSTITTFKSVESEFEALLEQATK